MVSSKLACPGSSGYELKKGDSLLMHLQEFLVVEDPQAVGKEGTQDPACKVPPVLA